jgi:hypothetical protein
MSTLNAFLLVIFVASATACSQSKNTPKPLGTINGRPIPARVFNVTRIMAINALRRDGKLAPEGTADEPTIAAKIQDERCGSLRGDVAFEARAQAVIDFKIRPTQRDLDEALQHMRVADSVKEVTALHDRTAVIVNALSAVYDKGMAPDDVYRQMVASHGIPEELWKAEVKTGSTAEGRAMIARPLKVTPQMYSQAITKAQRSLAESNKLDATVNEMIASSDPVFRTYINAWDASRRVSVTGSVSHINDPIANQYMDKKRAEWWKARLSKLQIVLSDPSLASTCHLGEMTGRELAGTMTFNMR